jgi:hypothetical protein
MRLALCYLEQMVRIYVAYVAETHSGLTSEDVPIRNEKRLGPRWI